MSYFASHPFLRLSPPLQIERQTNDKSSELSFEENGAL